MKTPKYTQMIRAAAITAEMMILDIESPVRFA
jgi:hypothetical protein